jgi:hypothetical protein
LKSIIVNPGQEFNPTIQCSDLDEWLKLSLAKIPSLPGFRKVLYAGSSIAEDFQRIHNHLAPLTSDIFGHGMLDREVGCMHAAQLRVRHPPGSTNETASEGEISFGAAAAKSLSGSDTFWNINKLGSNATLKPDRSIFYCVILALVKHAESECFPWRFMRRNAVDCNPAVEVLVVCKCCWMVRRALNRNVKDGILMTPKSGRSCAFLCSSKHALEGFPSQDCGKHGSWKIYNQTELPNPRKGIGAHVFVPNPKFAPQLCLCPGCMTLCRAWCADEECKLKKFGTSKGGNTSKCGTSKCGVHHCAQHRAFHHKSVQLAQNKEP